MRRTLLIAGVLVFAMAAAAVAAQVRRSDSEPKRVPPQASHEVLARRYAYPLKVSPNNRYLVDQRGRPFLLVGDSPQAMIANLGLDDAASYIANRRRAGINALWVHLLCVQYTGCRDDGTTLDGIAPFSRRGDLATPNARYFERVDAMLKLAARAGMAVFLDPIETGGWLDTLRANGVVKARAFGVFVGRRYRAFGNIVWSFGNDFQSWQNRADDALVLAVADGIRSSDPVHLRTIELNYPRSASLDDTRWRPLIQIDSAYTHFPTYAEVLKEYSRSDPMPVVMAEAGYEFEQNGSWMSKGTPNTLRRQEYWSALSGAAGQFYGNHYSWQFADGWKEHLDTVGATELTYFVNLLEPLPWYRLVPDRNHRVVTAGYGTYTTEGNATSSDYVTTASTSDGRLAISYLPVGGTVTLDTTRLRRIVLARWYDPTNGRFRAAARSPLRPARGIRLSAPLRNASGDRDWVLVLTAR